jgi:hypothetical protein
MVHGQNHPLMVPKLRKKPQKNTVNGTLDLTQLWELLNSQANFSVTYKGKVKRGLNSSRTLYVREMALNPEVKDEL